MNATDIEMIINKCKNYDGEIIIYGAGLLGHLLYKNLRNRYDVTIDYFCTSFDKCYIDEVTGVRVLSREQLRDHTEALYIIALNITFSKMAYETIKSYLLDIGVKNQNIIPNANDWAIKEAKPYIDAGGNLNMFTLSYHVTKICNLKCKMCAQLLFGPVKRRAFPREQIESDMLKVFSFIDRIEILKLIGGEVMCYPYLAQLIKLIKEYSNRVGVLEIYTNGAVHPTQELLREIKSYSKVGRVQVTISDYGRLSCAKGDWIRFGREFGIKINILGYSADGKDGYKGWIDCTEVVDLKENTYELYEKYATCGQRLDFVLEDSVIGPCTSYHMINYALDNPLDPKESLAINSGLSIDEMRDKIVAMGKDEKELVACKYCVWGSKIRDLLPRYPAAEQLDVFPK